MDASNMDPDDLREIEYNLDEELYGLDFYNLDDSARLILKFNEFQIEIWLYGETIDVLFVKNDEVKESEIQESTENVLSYIRDNIDEYR